MRTNYELIGAVHLIFDCLPMVVKVRSPNVYGFIQIPKYHAVFRLLS